MFKHIPNSPLPLREKFLMVVTIGALIAAFIGSGILGTRDGRAAREPHAVVALLTIVEPNGQALESIAVGDAISVDVCIKALNGVITEDMVQSPIGTTLRASCVDTTSGKVTSHDYPGKAPPRAHGSAPLTNSTQL